MEVGKEGVRWMWWAWVGGCRCDVDVDVDMDVDVSMRTLRSDLSRVYRSVCTMYWLKGFKDLESLIGKQLK